jgi:hypothetical protein
MARLLLARRPLTIKVTQTHHSVQVLIMKAVCLSQLPAIWVQLVQLIGACQPCCGISLQSAMLAAYMCVPAGKIDSTNTRTKRQSTSVLAVSTKERTPFAEVHLQIIDRQVFRECFARKSAWLHRLSFFF